MYQLYMEDMKEIKKVAVLPNILGPGSWEISYWSYPFLHIYFKWKSKILEMAITQLEMAEISSQGYGWKAYNLVYPSV